MRGTHGTCRSIAEQIKQDGFKLSSTGRRGGGIYFWGYTIDSIENYARNLAIGWWSFAKFKQGKYSGESDERCSVIFANFEVERDNFIDLEIQTIREKLIEYSLGVYDRVSGTEDEKISTIYDMFINDLEVKTNKQFKLVHVKIQQPKKFKQELPLDITGQPSCYVVKDQSCIEITRFEDIDDE